MLFLLLLCCVTSCLWFTLSLWPAGQSRLGFVWSVPVLEGAFTRAQPKPTVPENELQSALKRTKQLWCDWSNGPEFPSALKAYWNTSASSTRDIIPIPRQKMWINAANWSAHCCRMLVWKTGSDVLRGSLGFCGHSANWPWTLASNPSPWGGKQSSEWHLKLDTLLGESVSGQVSNNPINTAEKICGFLFWPLMKTCRWWFTPIRQKQSKLWREAERFLWLTGRYLPFAFVIINK